MKILGTVISLFAATITGGGGCGPEPTPKSCDKPTESFDYLGICCDERQKKKDEHGERICDSTIQIPDGGETPDGGVQCPTPDAGPSCEEDKIEVCVPRALDGGTEDGGIDGGVDGGVDVNPPDAGNPYTALGCNETAREVIGPAGTCEARNPCTGASVVYTQANTCEPRRHCPDNKLEDVNGNCYDSETECVWPCPLGMVAVKPFEGPPQCKNPPFAWEFACDPEREGINTKGTCHRLFDCPSGQVMENGSCKTAPFLWNNPCADVTKGYDTRDQQCRPLFDCSPGQVMENGTCRAKPFAWTNPCNANQCLAPDGVSCQTPSTSPAAEIRAEFLLTPSVAGPFNVSPGDTNVKLGTIYLDSTDPTASTQVSNLTLAVMVSDAGSVFAQGADGNVRAQDRLTNCRLKAWPPSMVVAGPVPIAADGSLVFPGPFTVGDYGFYDVVCDFVAIGSVGASDSFAIEIVGGQAQSPTIFRVSQMNGNPPRVVANVGCGYTVTLMDGSARLFPTRPFFSLAAGSPSGQATPGMIEVYRLQIEAGLCDDVSIQWLRFKAAYTDKTLNGWGSRLYDDVVQKTRVSETGQTTPIAIIMKTGDDPLAFHFKATFNGTLVVAKGTTRTISVWMDTTGASTTQHDTFTITPHEEVSWVGVTNPSLYPSSVKASDAAAAVGGTITF